MLGQKSPAGRGGQAARGGYAHLVAGSVLRAAQNRIGGRNRIAFRHGIGAGELCDADDGDDAERDAHNSASDGRAKGALVQRIGFQSHG